MLPPEMVGPGREYPSSSTVIVKSSLFVPGSPLSITSSLNVTGPVAAPPAVAVPMITDEQAVVVTLSIDEIGRAHV